MKYFLDRKLKVAGEGEKPAENELEIQIITEKEWESGTEYRGHKRELSRSMEHLQYCKAETFGTCALGTLSVPDKKDVWGTRLEMGYYLTERQCILIEKRQGELDGLLKRLGELEYDGRMGAGLFFAGVLNELIRDDTIWLQKKEEHLMMLEDELTKQDRADRKIQETLSSWRKELMFLHAFYEQMADMGEDIQENTEGIFSAEEVAAFGRFASRADRLHDHVEMLREYATQIREMYQEQMELEQNRTMNLLTVVTTLFLPLSILVGWYGMNFAYMPELQWKYGYGGVILFSILIVAAEIYYFKKKKMF